MKTYLVGGAVRDFLLGKSVADKDYVVVGATVDQMREAGFEQVGADFPVFLHPVTKDEYALARSERKAGRGYHGFLVNTDSITLEEDLARRDLTINAMAQGEDGSVVDPLGGRSDLTNKVLRHVGPAFVEDPVRVLRLLRFHASLGPEWRIHESTWSLVQHMVGSGELESLTSERVWKELAKGLMQPHAHLMIEGLRALRLFECRPFVPYGQGAVTSQMPFRQACQAGESLGARVCLAFASLSGGLSHTKGLPVELVRSSLAFTQLLQHVAKDSVQEDPVSGLLAVFESNGAFRSPAVMDTAMSAMAYVHSREHAEIARLLSSAREVDTQVISAAMAPGPQVGQAIREARLAAMGRAMTDASGVATVA